MTAAHSRRERRKKEVRERLLQAAWRLFSDQGYDETTVAEIAEAADVAKGTVFNYFPTKESIAEQILLWRIDLLGEQVLGEQDAPASAVARIKLVMKAMAAEFAPKQGLAHSGLMARIGAPAHRQSVHRMGSVLQELVVLAQAQGEIRDDVEPGLVARLLMTSWLYQFSKWRHEGSEFPGEGSLVQGVDVLIEGLDGRKGRSM
jgi:AcrR family transcriptional regulator